jgi:hypothetical protein
VALIAASSHVDAPFVMAMQTGRLLAVLAVGPAVARWVARRSAWAHRLTPARAGTFPGIERRPRGDNARSWPARGHSP